ncbi:proliferation marker protein Ki-67-like isoform X2 [Acipenser ruthenus]|uniref:proliferation marker protein Ki-67-like isoform X2 n=1 Tax=Acipenser ruthenus TaxID=7906 RepID=UPI00274277E2|nr:proliferation marker protein Ki-67-like isoform X2 [Acipenser ruthenus]
MPLYGKIVVIKRSGADGTEFPLTAQSCLFGRKPDCDIRIQLPHVSKEHCQIEVNENKEVIVTNLSAVNPTRLNGKIVQQSESLKDRDVITIIDRSFRFEYPPELTQKKRQSASAKNETLQVLHVQQVKDTVCLSPGNQRKSTTLTSDASYDLKEAKVIGTELLSEAHIKNATPGEKDASDTEFAHNHRGNQEKLLEGLSPFSQLYKTLKLQFQANDDHQASSKGGKTPRKASGDAAQTPLSRRKSDKISPTRAVKMPMEVKSTPLPQAPLSRITPNRGRKSFVCEKSAEEAMLQNLVSCVSSEEKDTSEDQLNKEIIDSPRSRRRSKVMNDLQSDAVNGETSQITSNMTNIIVTPKNDRRSTSRGRSSIHIVTSADNEDDGFVEPSVSDNEGSSVNSTLKSTGKGRPRKSPLKDDHAGGNYSVCESVKEKPTVVENLIGTDQETPKRRRRSSQPTPVKSAEKEKDSGEEAQHKQDRFSKAKETPKSKRNSSQFTLQRSISADEVLKEIQELPSSAKKSSEEMASGGKTEMPKKGRKSIESETPASEAELTPKKVSSSPRWRSRSLSPASLETQDPVKKNVNGIITPQEEKKVATPKKTQKSPVINEVSPKQKTPKGSPTRRHSGKAMLKAEEVLSEIEALAPPSGENGAVETGNKKTSSKKRRSGELQEKLAEPPLKRKRVSFAGHLSPELFDKRLPPDSPLRKGAMPTRFSLSVGSKGPSVLRRASAVGIKYSLIKEFSEDTLSSLKPSPNKKASPKKTPSKPNTLSPDKKSPKPIAKTPSPARSVAKTPSPGRKSLAGAGKTPILTSLTAKIPSSDQKSPNVADVEPSPGQKSPTSAAKTPSLARSVAKTTSPGRQLPASALTITKTPPPGRKSPARSVTMTPSPARSVTKMPSPATTITKTPPPGRKSPARSVTRTPSPARSVTRTPSPAMPLTRTPSPARPVTRTPSPARPVTRTPSPARPVTRTPSPARPVTRTPSPARPVTRTPSPARPVTRTPSPATTITKTPPPGRKSPDRSVTMTPSGARSVTMTPSGARSVTMTPSPARSVTKMPSPATTITKTPPPGRKSPARSVTKMPSPATTITKTPPPGRKSPARSVTRTPSGARSVTRTPSGARSVTRTPSGARSVTRTPSGARSVTRTPSGARSVTRTPPGARSVTMTPPPARSVTKMPSPATTITKTPPPGRKSPARSVTKMPSPATTITKTPPPGRKSPARSVTMMPSPARSVTKMPSPATTITKTPPPGRKSPARSVTMTPSPARSVTRTPSSNRKYLSGTAKTPSPAMSLAKTPSPSRMSLTGAAKTPSPSGAAKTPTPSRRSLAGAAEMPSANKSVTKTPSTGRKSLGTNTNTTPVVSTATPKSGTPYVRGRFSISHISTPSPIPEQSTVASKAEPVAEEIHFDAVTPKPSLRRKNIQSTAKKTPSRRKSSGLDVVRSRSGASKANLLVARSWADIVKLGAAKTQGMVFAKKQVPKAKKVTIKKVTSKMPKTPVKKIKDHFSTGHADSPVTIVVGRAHARAVKPAGQVPKLVRNVALMKRSMEMNESFTGIAEMFSTPVNEKPRRTPRRSSASTEVVCSTPVSLTDASVLNTPEETGEMVVSPLSAPSTARRGRYKDAVTCLQEKESSYSAVKTPVKEIIAPINLSGGSQVRVQPSEEVVYTSEKMQSLVEKTAAEIGEGCKKLMRTPKQKAEPLVALTGVKRLMKTPKQKSKQIEDFRGIKRLMRTPKEPKVQIIEDLVGVKRVMTTPKQKASPVEDMVGIKRLMRTPKHKGESVEYMSGISRTMKSPKLKIAPIEEFAGLQELMEQPEEKKQDHESRVNIETLEALETKRESKKHESVKTLAILAQSSIAQQPPSRRSRCKDGQISVLPTPLNNSGRPEQVKLTMDIEEDSAVKSSTDTPNGSVKASPAQTASTRKSGRGRKASDVELSSLEAISVEVCSVKSDNISKPTTECVKLSPTPKRATHGTENKDTSRSDTLGSPAFEIALVQESSIDSIKLSTPSRRSQHGNEKDTVQNESSLLSLPANKPQRGMKGMQNVEQNHASIEPADLTVEIIKASPVSTKWTHSGQIKEVEMPATPPATKSGKETKQKIEEVAHMLNEVAAAEERVSQSVSSPAAKRSHHGAIKDVAELDTSASPAAMKKALRGRKAQHHSDDTQSTSTEVVAAESVMHLPMLKRSQRGAVKDVTEKAITSSPAPKKSGRGRKAKQNSEVKHETSTEVVAAENIMSLSLPMPKRSRRGAVNDIVEEEITASPAPLKKSGRGRKAKPNSDDIQETSAEVVVAEESSPFSTAKRSEQGAVKGTTELETTASPAPIKTSGKGRKAKPNSDDTQVTAVQVVSAGESLPESVMRTPRTKKSQGAVKDTAELETTASPAPTKKSGRGRKAKQNSKDQPELFTEVVAAEESCPENVILSPATKRLQQGAVKGTVGVETTTSPAPTKKSGRGRKPKPNLDGRHETPVEAVAAESVMSSPSTKRSRRGAKRDSAEVETTISSAPTKISGRGRKAKQNTEDIRETSLEVVAVEESCPGSLMLSPTPKRSRRGVVNHTAEVKTIASPAHAKKYGRGRTAKQNSNDTQETSIEVTAAENCPESVMPSPTTKRSQRGAMKNTAEAATTAAPIKKSGRGRKVKHVEEIDHTSTEVPEESQAESVKMSPLSKRSRRCSIEDTDMQKTRCGKKVAPVRETRGATKKNADDAETEEPETSKNSVIMDKIKNLSKKNVKWSTVLTVENDTPENNAVEHLPATDKRLQRGKARSEKGETLDLDEVPVQLAKPRRGRPGRKPKMTEAEIVQEQVADEPSSKEESKPAVWVSSKREASLEIISSNVTVIEKEGLRGKSGSKRKMICKESANANFEEQEHLLIEVAPKRGRRGKAKTTVDEEAQSSTGPSASTVEIKAVSVVETMKPRSIKRTGRTKASSQQKLDLPKETNDHVIDESASQAEKLVKSKKPIGRGKRKLELEAETEADVSFLSPLMSTRGKRANLTNEAETRTLETAANDENVTRGKVSRRGAAASDKKTAAAKTEGKPVRSTRRR